MGIRTKNTNHELSAREKLPVDVEALKESGTSAEEVLESNTPEAEVNAIAEEAKEEAVEEVLNELSEGKALADDSIPAQEEIAENTVEDNEEEEEASVTELKENPVLGDNEAGNNLDTSSIQGESDDELSGITEAQTEDGTKEEQSSVEEADNETSKGVLEAKSDIEKASPVDDNDDKESTVEIVQEDIVSEGENSVVEETETETEEDKGELVNEGTKESEEERKETLVRFQQLNNIDPESKLSVVKEVLVSEQDDEENPGAIEPEKQERSKDLSSKSNEVQEKAVTSPEKKAKAGAKKTKKASQKADKSLSLSKPGYFVSPHQRIEVSALSHAVIQAKKANSGATKMSLGSFELVDSGKEDKDSSSIYTHIPQSVLPEIKFFMTDKQHIELGKPITLSWEVLNALKVEIDNGVGEVTDWGMVKVYPDENITYTLRAVSLAGETSRKIKLKLPKPEIEYFRAAENEILIGFPTILHWSIRNAAEIYIDKGVGSVDPGQSFTEAYFQVPGQCTLTAGNKSGETSYTIELALSLPEIHFFEATNPTILQGETNALHWEVSNATAVYIDQQIGEVTDTNRVEVDADKTKVYTLTAVNHRGSTQKTTRLVLPPPKILYFEPSSELVMEDQQAIKLSWEVENAYSVSLDNEIGDVTNRTSVIVRPNKAVTNYKLTARGHSGIATKEVQLTMFPIPVDNNLLKSLDEEKKLEYSAKNSIRGKGNLGMDNFDLDAALEEMQDELETTMNDFKKKMKEAKKKNRSKGFSAPPKPSRPELSHHNATDPLLQAEEVLNGASEEHTDSPVIPKEYKKIELTEDMLSLEKPKIREEASKIYKSILNKIKNKLKP